MPAVQADSILEACAACGARNRIPARRLGDRPKCGRCGAPLGAGKVIEVGDATFAAEVEQSPLPVLVDLWAPWCGPCRAVAPILEDLARARAGRLKVCKVNVDENPRTAARFQVRSIPMLLLFQASRPVDQLLGAQSRGALEAWLDRR